MLARPEIERAKLSDEQRTHLRLLEQQRITLARARADAERKLDVAERDRAGLRRLTRGRRRDALRSEITLQRAAIGMADEKLVELEQQGARVRQSAPGCDRELATRSRVRERTLDRAPPNRARGLGVEL